MSGRGAEAIFRNYALTDIEVDENNESYKSLDGVLFIWLGKQLNARKKAQQREEQSETE